MYEEDSDGQKINKVPAVEELLQSYPLLWKQLTLIRFTIAKTGLKNLKQI